MAWNFDGKTAIVTGGARGIGEAVAKALARAGCRVAILDADFAAAQEVCDSLNEEMEVAKAYACNIAYEEEIESSIKKAMADFTSFDILFNNAGINRRKKLNEWTASDWKALLDVNFIGSFCVARAVGQIMAERGSGSIVNMAALGGAVVGLGRGTEIYAGTKGAVAAMSRDLAAEWAPYGVRVNCVAPGWIETSMNAPLLAHPVARQKVIERVPLGRWGKPEDIVGPVLFLASDASAYITGHLLPIDGGASSIIRLTSDDVIQ